MEQADHHEFVINRHKGHADRSGRASIADAATSVASNGVPRLGGGRGS